MKNAELIDAYFDGQINEMEKQDLFKKMSQDIELKREFNFQSEVIEGIKSARKAELKARLDNVPIGGKSISGTKMAALGGVLLVAGAAYFLYPVQVENATPEKIIPEVTAENTESTTLTSEAEEKEVKTVAENKPVAEPAAVAMKKEKSERTKPAESSAVAEVSETATTVTDEETTTPETIIKANTPKINKPVAMEPMDIDDSEEGEDELLPKLTIAKSDTEINSPTEVKIDNSKKKYPFHYQMKEGRLTLLGDFDSELYEILEFNTEEGNMLYFCYEDKFYNLDKHQSEVKALKEVTDPSLISQLKAARKN